MSYFLLQISINTFIKDKDHLVDNAPISSSHI